MLNTFAAVSLAPDWLLDRGYVLELAAVADSPGQPLIVRECGDTLRMIVSQGDRRQSSASPATMASFADSAAECFASLVEMLAVSHA